MRTIVRASLAALAVLSTVVGSAHAQRVLERLEEKQFGQPKTPLVVDPSRGKEKEAEKPAERGYLGVITDEGTDKGRGVRVIDVVKGSPAEEAGLKVGDLITAIAEKPVRQTTDVPAATQGAGPGTKLGITVVRDGAMRTILVTLGRRPDDSKLPPPPPDRAPGSGTPPPEPQPPAEAPGRPPAGVGGGAAPPRLGVMMQSYSEDPRLVLGRAPIRGVQVLEVLANTPAYAGGLRAGDVIVAVGGGAVIGTQELRDSLAARRAGEEVEVSFYRGQTMYRQKIRLAGAASGDPPIAPPPAVVGPGGALPRETSDQQRIESLERRVRELERRLNELEKKPAPPAGKE